MKVIDNEIGENGLSRILVRNGFGDLKVKIGDNEVTCVRNILMNGNSTIRKLLLDEKQSEVLELYEKCEINSFLEVEKYYSGGCMELNDNNVCNILRFSIYYNDNRIMLICNKYLKNHLNESILINIINTIDISKLNDLRELCEDSIKLNGYKCLNEDSLLLKQDLRCLKFLLNNKHLIIIDETWLLNRLLLWYKKVLKESSEEKNEEELKEFKELLKEKINEYEINPEEIEKENLNELNELNIEIKEKPNYISIPMKEVKNDKLINIIHRYYILEDEEIELSMNEIEILTGEEVKEEMINLLSNDDIKVIEIILNIIMKLRISEIILNEIKNKLLGKLCIEYNENKRNRSLKCLSLFLDERDNIHIIERLCGKEILYEILNEEYNLNSKTKELIIEYIREMKLNLEEEEEMSKIILNKEILEELVKNETTLFSYPQSEYSFKINEEISIIPSFDGNRCEFSISPSLPLGLTINKENGIINGKVEREIEKKEYEILCKNVKNEKKFKISLEILLATFSELNKNQYISISNNEKLITNTNDKWNHCYLNLKMENGIYHIKYKFHQNENEYDAIMLGLSTNNTYSGNRIFDKSTTCNFYAWNGKSQDNTKYCHIGTIVNLNPQFNDCEDGSIYEVIVDMNKREFWISHNNSSPVLLVKDLPSPLYPYAELFYQNSSIELLSISHQK